MAGVPAWTKWMLLAGSLFCAGLGWLFGGFLGGLLVGLGLIGLVNAFAVSAAVAMIRRRRQSPGPN